MYHENVRCHNGPDRISIFWSDFEPRFGTPGIRGLIKCDPSTSHLATFRRQKYLRKFHRRDCRGQLVDDELKSKGKAAVDVIGGRFGKSGGGIIQSTFFFLIPSFTFLEATPYFAAIFFVIVILWLYAVKALSTEYENQLKV